MGGTTACRRILYVAVLLKDLDLAEEAQSAYSGKPAAFKCVCSVVLVKSRKMVF